MLGVDGTVNNGVKVMIVIDGTRNGTNDYRIFGKASLPTRPSAILSAFGKYILRKVTDAMY
jgi:hypothetical protein